MSSRSRRGRGGTIVLVAALGARLATTTIAQAPATAPAVTQTPPGNGANGDEILSDPIRCWWKTNTNAVQLGEHFTLTLTCGVVETSRVTVVPDLTSLEPGTVQLAPFEVVNGVRYKDIQDGPWRHLQYEYTLRLLGEGYFGRDVDIPPLTITYNIQSAGGDGGGTQGRDQRYGLPALPIRIISLAPLKATDIRDAPRETFADIEARKFRATAELIAAGVFFGFAAVLLGFAAVRVARRRRLRAPVVARPLPSSAVLAGCLRTLGQLRSRVAGAGWTPDLVARGLAVMRIAGAVALDRPVAQQRADTTMPRQEGQIVVRKGVLGRALLSAPTTEDAFTERLASKPDLDRRARAMLEQFRDSLHAFSLACYSRRDQLETTALDTALENGTRAIQRLRFAKRWPMSTGTRIMKSAASLGDTVWARPENF